eukprot:jgi/Orpsp1_1/1191094/evm.model.d7180000083464.1
MTQFRINDIDDLINHISKWNISTKKYPNDFPKKDFKPLKNNYNSMEEYRKIIEPLFYLECYEQFRKFCVSMKEKRLNIEENAVKVTISEFEIEDIEDNSTNNDKETNKNLSQGIFEILMPNYFICGYQGINFKNKKRIDALDSMERRASGNIRKNDLIYLAKISSDLSKIHYETIVKSEISRDAEKDLISIPSRNDLNNYTPVFCTKKMTQNEIKEFREELKIKNGNSFWICIYANCFGTAIKEFRALDILSKNPQFEICKEILTGKCRNKITNEDDDSDIIKEILGNEFKMDDYWSSIIIKIYQNSNLDKKERSDLTSILLPGENDKENESITIGKDEYRIIKHLQKDILLPFTSDEQKLLYHRIFESQGKKFYLNTKIGNLLLNNGKKVKLNNTIDEIIKQYGLNITQATILAKVKQNEKFLSLIQGPPGTGKTKMITAFIYQELREARLKNDNTNKKSYNNSRYIRNKILVCAPSNTACNEIARRLKRENVNTVIKTIRFAPEEQVDNTISHITVDKMAAKKLYYRITKVKNIFDLAPSFNIPTTILEKLKNHHDNIQSKTYELTHKRKMLAHMIHTEKKNKKVIDKIYEDICLLENELDSYIQIFIDNLLLIDEPDFKDYKDFIINSAIDCKQRVFNEADVIVTTLTSSSNEYINKIKNQFNLLIVDEASQATELITLIPFCYNIPKAVLIGDSKQLPPTVINSTVAEQNYDRSFFQRIESNSPNSVHLLNIQYRMHPMISKLSSQCFYSNAIVNGDNVTSKKWQKDWCEQNSDFGPLMFYDIKGFTNNNDGSLNNVKEANQILDFITDFLQSPEYVGFNSKISIISPYRAQVNLIKYKLKNYYRNALKKFNTTIDLEEFKKLNLNDKKLNLKLDIKDEVNGKQNKNILKRFNILDNINVNTVDSYQGQESDIVILSCVRSNTHSLGFLRDKRRLNVSITRARYTLIIFGDSDTLCKDKEWKKIINEIKKMKRFKSVSN